MMKTRLLAGMALFLMFISSCDDTTDTIGNSLTNETDRFEIITDTFNVETRSIVVDSILSRSQYNYLGHIKDPETNTYITSSFTTQFAILESFDNTPQFPAADSIVSKDANGEIIADSCRLQLYFYSSIGDSLNPMKLTAYELAKPIEEGFSYYTNFNPETAGILRTDNNAIRKNKTYTVVDLNLSDSSRAMIVDKKNMENISIALNDRYTHKNGKSYNNYGTYIMHKYYENPDNYKNSYNFTHNVCPGFYIKSTDGIGVMSEVYMAELLVFYRFISNDSVYKGSKLLSGTEEVMQTTYITNDKESIEKLAQDNTCTYLKTPAGIFTEVTLPVEAIHRGHENDTISSAKIVFNHMNSEEGNILNAPTTLLMIPKDSLYSYFENKNLPDNKSSYLAVYNKSYQTYTYNNISNLVSKMYKAKLYGNASKDWNKVVLVPVSVSYNSSSASASITNVSNEMSLKSTKLVGGSANTHKPVTISVIYNKFNK